MKTEGQLEAAHKSSVKKACQGPRDMLVACLLRSDCVLKSGKSVGDCVRSPSELPMECQHLISNFSDCKKGMLDMRRRFRGNHLSDEAKKRPHSLWRSAASVENVGPGNESVGADDLVDETR